uniref:Uncharacterized protein n=1 Tax=Romanomermis culicivorax TaxID=13658 RepID=A0A915IWW7_ROMCU
MRNGKGRKQEKYGERNENKKRRKVRFLGDDDDALRPFLLPNTRRQMRRKREPMPGYRPATLTDIQQICCNVGCEIRDLLSYCDPFGPWNS